MRGQSELFGGPGFDLDLYTLPLNSTESMLGLGLRLGLGLGLELGLGIGLELGLGLGLGLWQGLN